MGPNLNRAHKNNGGANSQPNGARGRSSNTFTNEAWDLELFKESLERVVRIGHTVTREDDAVPKGDGSTVWHWRAKKAPRWTEASL